MHFKKIIISLFTTAASLALAAPAAAPVLAPAPASALAARDSAYNDHGTFSYDGTAPCSNDLVHYDIDYNYVTHCTSPNASGTQKCTYHYNSRGTATTFDSGTKYQLISAQNQKYEFEVNPPYAYTYRANVRVRATKQGTGLVYTGTQLVTFSYDEINGYQEEIKRIEFECT